MTKKLVPYRLAKVGIVAAIVGGILDLSEVTKTFPYPTSIIGNVIIFVAILAIAIDLCKGGILD